MSAAAPRCATPLLSGLGRKLAPLGYRVRTRPLLARTLLFLLPDWKVTLQLPEIGPFRLRLRRHRYLWLRGPSATEQFAWKALPSLAPAAPVFYDVGANIGLYTRFALSRLSAARVVAFEPWQPNVSLLRENVALAGAAERVTIVETALSDENGQLEFQVDDVQSTSGTLDKVTGGRPAEGRGNLRLAPKLTRVPSRRLDDLVGEGGLPAPDVLKIDVEGAEDLVLSGAERLLAERRPHLLVELHGEAAARAVVARLLELGYRCHGRGSRALLPDGEGPIDADVLDRISGRYDLEMVAAVPA